MTKRIAIPTWPLNAWLLMLVLGGWHDQVPRVPAPNYWLTLGTIMGVQIIGRALWKHEDEELGSVEWRKK